MENSSLADGDTTMFEGFVECFTPPDPKALVWDAVLKGDENRKMNVLVGTWFSGPLRFNQHVEVIGPWREQELLRPRPPRPLRWLRRLRYRSRAPAGEQAPAKGYIEVETLTDLDTDAKFSRNGARLVGRVPAEGKIEGKIAEIFDLALLGLSTVTGGSTTAGYVFDIRTDGGLRTVVMRGRKRAPGPRLHKGVKVRLSGMEDEHHIIHATSVEYVTSPGVVHVLPARWHWWPVVLAAVPATVLAAVPWIAGIGDVAPPFGVAFGVAFTALCLIGVLAVGWLTWRSRRS